MADLSLATDLLRDAMETIRVASDLVQGESAALKGQDSSVVTYHWSRMPGVFLIKDTGAPAVGTFTGTVREWYETLIEVIIDMMNVVMRTYDLDDDCSLVMSSYLATVLECSVLFQYDNRGRRSRRGRLPFHNIAVDVSESVPQGEISLVRRPFDWRLPGKRIGTVIVHDL